MNLQQTIRRILREDSRVYDDDPKRNTVPFDERLTFDVDKLLSVGAVFITPAIDGDPKSETYKKWLDEPYVHLITLKNVIETEPDSWIHKAISKKGNPESYRKDFVYKFYDGKYNQILWSLEKLGIDPNEMIEDKDNSIKETIIRVLREESGALGDAKVIAELNKHIVDEINDVKSKLPKPTLDIKIIDTNAVINGAAIYLKSTVPTTLQAMKSGKGGDVFVQNMLNKLLTLVESELKKGFPDNLIGWGKKKSIQLLSPSKEELKKTLEGSSEFDNYFQMFVDLVDFPFVISMMDEVQPYLTKINNFDDQKNEWLKKNRKIIKNLIIDKILNFIYS